MIPFGSPTSVCDARVCRDAKLSAQAGFELTDDFVAELFRNVVGANVDDRFLERA
jgi:hypothetical protein